MSDFFQLRKVPPFIQRVIAGAACVVILLIVWFIVTRENANGERMVERINLPSPGETLSSFPSLWFDRALTRNAGTSLYRIVLGFGLAAIVGIPIGVICGTWPWFNAFLAPVTVFGRNVPMSAMLPLTMVWFETGEKQKIMFIFVACVAFVISDSARAVASVHERYVQSALTLGASRLQVLFKVLVPLALPDIFGSLRLLFGLAFGYIILAEIVNMDGGLGDLITTSQRIGPKEHVYLILIVISLMAYGIDRALAALQARLFPYSEA